MAQSQLEKVRCSRRRTRTSAPPSSDPQGSHVDLRGSFSCSRGSHPPYTSRLRGLTSRATQPDLSKGMKSLCIFMIMIIICIAQIYYSLGRMTLPFCEHNRDSMIGALAVMGHPAKQGDGRIAPPARLQTPDWRGFFPWMKVPWMNSTVFATPSWQSLLPHLPPGS